MTKKQHPNSIANLDKGRRKFTSEDGYASQCAKNGVKKRQVIKPVEGYLKEQLAEQDESGVPTKEAIVRNLIEQVKAGNMKAWELMLKLIGEYPADQVQMIINAPDDADVAALVAELKQNDQGRSEEGSDK